jgi:ubiquinone/menaquinone biosynthesis C-methylase UbiE
MKIVKIACDTVDPTRIFGDRVENYAKYRPTYSPQAIQFIVNKLVQNQSFEVADIGSGTGIFTGLLLNEGLRVCAVEPNGEMRQAAELALANNPRFRSVHGKAEQTMLPDHSIGTITAAQAFHWFDIEKARSEFQRILVPDGNVVLVWNTRRQGDGAFHDSYEGIVEKYATRPRAKPMEDGSHRHPSQDRFFGVERYECEEFSHSTELDLAALLGLYDSISYSPKKGTPSYDAARRELTDSFSKYAANGVVSIEYLTQVFFGRL